LPKLDERMENRRGVSNPGLTERLLGYHADEFLAKSVFSLTTKADGWSQK